MAPVKKVNRIIVPTSTQYNNCGLHIIVPHLLPFIRNDEAMDATLPALSEAVANPGPRKLFRGTKGYQYFIAAFAEYYQIPTTDNLGAKISKLLEQYTHPQDMETLLGPVLRVMLKKVLLNSQEHKDTLQASFQVIVNKCHDEYRAQFPRMRNQRHLQNWLAAYAWSREDEHEELFVPNKGVIAEAIYQNRASDVTSYWDRAYQNYCNYQADPTQGVYVSESQISLLCASMKFDFKYVLPNSRLSQSGVAIARPLATVIAKNASGVHWEVVATRRTSWQVAKENNQQSVFRSYQDFSIQFPATFGWNRSQIADLQSRFREKIQQIVTSGKPFNETCYSLLSQSNWANNNAFSGMVEIIAEQLKQPVMPSFLNTAGFNQFVQHFREHYELDTALQKRMVISKMKSLLQQYPAAQDQFMLLSPVLRKMMTGNAYSRQDIEVAALKAICLQFKIHLQFYVMDQRNVASEFGKAIDNQCAQPLATLAMTFKDTQWCQVEKDYFSFLQKNAIQQYSPYSVLKTTDSTRSYIRRLQQGIADYFRTGVMFCDHAIKSSHPSKVIVPSEEGVARNWTPLHQAVQDNQLAQVAERLERGEDWRQQADYRITLKTGLNVFMKRMTALDVAAYQDNRPMLSLILAHANDRIDQPFLQKGYEIVLQWHFGQAIYPFLQEPSIQHSLRSLMIAAADRDLGLIQALLAKGALNNDKHNAFKNVMTLALNAASSDLTFALTVQREALNTLYQHKIKHKESSASFTLSTEEITLLMSCLQRNKPELIDNVLSYYQKLLAEKKLLTDSNEAVNENIRQILLEVAKVACEAIAKRNEKNLITCLIAGENCLEMAGKYNPLHSALQVENYSFFEHTYEKFYLDRLKTHVGRELTPEETAYWREQAFRSLNAFSQVAIDDYQRTFAYRLQNHRERVALDQRLLISSSWLDTAQIYGDIAKLKARSIKDTSVDKFLKKNQYSNTVYSNKLYSYGQFVLTAGFMTYMLSNAPFLFVLNMGWLLSQGVVKKPILQVIGKAGAYAAPMVGADAKTAEQYLPYFANEGFSCALMPEYYALSTALGLGIYAISDRIPHENQRAALHLIADTIASQWVRGSENNLVVDERNSYHLQNSLQAYIGEQGASYLTPMVAGTQNAFNKLNEAINYPVTALKPYFSEHVLPHIGGMLDSPFVKTMQNVHSVLRYVPLQINAIQNRTLAGIDHNLLEVMGDSIYKNERLHAAQMLNTQQAQLALNNAEKALSESQEKGTEAAVLEKQQTTVETLTTALEAAITREEELFQLTEGYSYYQAWQDKYTQMKYAEADAVHSAEQKSALRQAAEQAFQLSQFYNGDLVNQNGQHWQNYVDELFTEYRGNILDVTNIPNTVANIINNACNINSDRNQIASYCANELIRLRYPFYPKMGDSIQIEAERQRYINEISTYELSGYHRNHHRAQQRLHDYIQAKLTDTRKKVHVPRYKRVLKPFVNEILGKTIGYIPFKDFKGGRMGGAGNVGLQVGTQVGQPVRVDFTIANTPVYNLRGAEKVLGSQLNALDLRSLRSVSGSSQPSNTVLPPLSVGQTGNTQLALDNPFLQGILAEQLAEILNTKSNEVSSQQAVKTNDHRYDTRQKSRERQQQVLDEFLVKPWEKTLSAEMGGVGSIPSQDSTSTSIPTATTSRSHVVVEQLLKFLGIGLAEAMPAAVAPMGAAPVEGAGIHHANNITISAEMKERISQLFTAFQIVFADRLTLGVSTDLTRRQREIARLQQPYSGANPEEMPDDLDSTSLPVVSSQGSRTESLPSAQLNINQYTFPLLKLASLFYEYRTNKDPEGWSKKGRIKAQLLPNEGKIRYVPPKDYHPSEPLPRGPNNGFYDAFRNEWVKGPSRTPGEPFEWDIQLSKQGRNQLGWASRDQKHLNVSLKGKITHR